MKDPFVENKQVFLDKFYGWYLKEVPLDSATKVTDFLIDHIGKAHELTWTVANRFCVDAKAVINCITVLAIYLTNVDDTIIKTQYACTIDLPNES